MPSCRSIHHRRWLRLRGYDYSQTSAYFVTICARNRENLFGKVENERMVLNDAGRVVQTVWEGLSQRFPTIELDAFVVMPNHIHGIIVLVGAQFIAPGDDLPAARTNPGAINRAPTLGKIVRAFKAVTTRLIRLEGFPKFEWQRNYFEHVIRNDESLNRIRQYIATNPLRWELDRENPRRKGEDEFDRWLASPM